MSLATFEANPDSDNEPWIERPAFQEQKFRIRNWHLMFICFCSFGILMVLICCCIKIRIPRTKQEIEADYKRKRIASKFRKRLKIIRNQDMGGIDLRKALEIIIEADYKNDALQQERTIVDEKDVLVPNAGNPNFVKAAKNLIKAGKICAINMNKSAPQT